MGIGAGPAAGQDDPHRLARQRAREAVGIGTGMILAPMEQARGIGGIDPFLRFGRLPDAAHVQQDDIEQFQLGGGRGVVRQERRRGPRIGAGKDPHPVGPAHGPAGPGGIAHLRGEQADVIILFDLVEFLSRPVGAFLRADETAQAETFEGITQFVGAIIQIDGRRGRDQGKDFRL